MATVMERSPRAVMPSIGLVLGAGGVVGSAWHAGVLAALDADTSWDARTADVVVGTSAGSVVAASLRAGLSPGDHLARATGTPLSPAGATLVARMGPVDELPVRPQRPSSAWPANPRLALNASWPPWPWRPLLGLAGVLPRGATSTDGIGDRLRELSGGERWPPMATWVVAVRLADGRRVVFGRDAVADPEPDLALAVQASCAVPGVLAPVRIGGAEHIDGGVHSTTNADLLADLAFDAVIVSAPMAGRFRSLRPSPQALSRVAARTQVDREVAAIRRRGTPVLVVQPGAADMAEMDGRTMDPTRRDPVARQAQRSTRALLAGPGAAEVVAILRRA